MRVKSNALRGWCRRRADSPSVATLLEEVDPDAYYATVGHDGRGFRVPADLDDSICNFQRLSMANRDKFVRAGFWMYMAIAYPLDARLLEMALLALMCF